MQHDKQLEYSVTNMMRPVHNLGKILFAIALWFCTISFHAPIVHSQILTLAWSPSTNANISQYAIYRKTGEQVSFNHLATIAHPDTIYIDNNLEWGNHYYYVATAIDIYGNESGYSNMIDTTLTLITGNDENIQPERFSLFQNYPNPFNASTNITYFLPIEAEVKISIFNLHGGKIRQLIHELQNAGKHLIQWDGTAEDGGIVAAGLYLYKIEAQHFLEVKKMIFLK